jgi:hypothetical protein
MVDKFNRTAISFVTEVPAKDDNSTERVKDP